MSDDKTKQGSADRDRINVHEPYEVEYWTKELGVTPDELRKAVDSAGVMAKDVRAKLGKQVGDADRR